MYHAVTTPAPFYHRLARSRPPIAPSLLGARPTSAILNHMSVRPVAALLNCKAVSRFSAPARGRTRNVFSVSGRGSKGGCMKADAVVFPILGQTTACAVRTAEVGVGRSVSQGSRAGSRLRVSMFARTYRLAMISVHLHPGADHRSYLEELRLDFDALRLDRLEALAAIAATPQPARTARVLRDIACDAPACEAV